MKNFLAVWKASLKWGGSCGIRERAVASFSSSASLRSSLSASVKGHVHLLRIGTVLMLRTMQFVNGLLGHQSNGLFVDG